VIPGNADGDAGMSPLVDLVLQADNAFSVVHAQSADVNLSFPHELGHQFGAGHNPETGDVTRTGYSHGFVKPDCEWRTVMAYVKPACDPLVQVPTRLHYWSGCKIRIDGVHPGSPLVHNNSRMINETAWTVGGFR
jgi:hypothetical protein